MSWRFLAPAVSSIVFFVSALAGASATAQESREHAILEIQQLIEAGDLDQARRLLETAAGNFPQDAGFDNLLGVIEAQQGHYSAAETAFRRAIRRDPKFTGAYLNLGRLYQEDFPSDPQATGKALAIYKKVLTYDGGNEEANYQSGSLLLRQGAFEQSLVHLSRLPARTQKTAQTLSLLCAAYAGLRKRNQTDELFTRLMQLPEFSQPDLRQMLPWLRAGQRNDLIISAAEAFERREPLSADIEHSLALAYEVSGKLAEARSALEQFVTHGNFSVAGLMELARVAHEQKDYLGSLGYLAHARDLDPNNASIHYSFGLVCLDQDLIAEARNSFEKAVQLKPDNPDYNYMMGVTSVFRHDPGEAVPYFQKYLALKPQDPRGQLALGVAFFRAKDYDSALPWFTRAAKTSTTATTAHYYLGALAVEQDRLDDARSELELAIRANPDYADALAELGHYYFLEKKYQDSQKWLDRALRADPNHFSANFYLLTLYARTGDPRRETQAKRYDDLAKLQEQKNRDVMRLVEVRPFETPQP
jgi:tetratricopeptide (TPR) repeat protein